MVTAFQSSSSSANPGSLTTITSGFRSATLFVGKKSKSNTVFGKNTSSRYLSTALRPTYSATTNRHGVVYRTENLDVLLLRALTFQMLKIGFDVGEIQPETRDELRSLLEELRYPSMMCMGFNSAPLGLLFSRSTNTVGNRSAITDLNNNTSSNTKDYILPNMVRMRHLKGKTHRSNMLTDANYSSMTNGDRRYLKFRSLAYSEFCLFVQVIPFLFYYCHSVGYSNRDNRMKDSNLNQNISESSSFLPYFVLMNWPLKIFFSVWLRSCKLVFILNWTVVILWS